MSDKRYPDEFKIEAVRQIVERGHKVADVAARLGERAAQVIPLSPPPSPVSVPRHRGAGRIQQEFSEIVLVPGPIQA